MNNLTIIRLTLGIALLALASPALADFSQGECCGPVNGGCVSWCNKSSCSGNGDCDLNKLTIPSGTSSATPGFREALRTLSRSEQRQARRLVAVSGATGSKEPDYEPGGGLTTGSGPGLAQQGGDHATVPMKHGSCGLDCGTHVLAVQSGNLNVPFKIGMSCSGNQQVTSLTYQLQGKGVVKVVQAATAAPFSQDLNLRPFSKAELEEACRVALGGDWPTPGFHKNPTKSVSTSLEETVTVRGRCAGSSTITRQFPAELTVSCQDRSFSTRRR